MTANLQLVIVAAGDLCRVELSGVVDEQADLSSLMSLTGRVELHLRGIRRINSAGVSKWLDAMQRLDARSVFTVEECSPAVVVQLNMVNDFMGRATVSSFYAPMYCTGCDRESEHLFTTRECVEIGRLPPVACHVCASTLQLEEPEERYLLFLREPTPMVTNGAATPRRPTAPRM